MSSDSGHMGHPSYERRLTLSQYYFFFQTSQIPFHESLVFSNSASLHAAFLANWPGHVIHFFKHISDRLHCITNTFVVPLMFPLTMLFLSFSDFVAIIDIALSASIPPTATQHLADQHITAAFGVYNKTIQFTLPPRHQIHQLHRLRLVQTPLCSFF